MRQPSGGWFQGMSAPSVDLGDVSRTPRRRRRGASPRPGRRPARACEGQVRTETLWVYDRDKANLDITWLKDPSLADADDGVSPEVIAREIVDDLQCALLEFEAVATALEARAAERSGGSEPEHPCLLSR